MGAPVKPGEGGKPTCFGVRLVPVVGSWRGTFILILIFVSPPATSFPVFVVACLTPYPCTDHLTSFECHSLCLAHGVPTSSSHVRNTVVTNIIMPSTSAPIL